MSNTRLFSPIQLNAKSEVSLGDEQARYIGKVLRQRAGDTLTLFDGTGGEFNCTVVSVNKSSVVINVGELVNTALESPLSIHLLQGVSRGERMDFVVQKATELGVTRITPVISEFSVVKLDEQRAQKRQLHWSKIAISACEQCGRNSLPKIESPIVLRKWFGENFGKADTKIVLVPGAPTNLSVLAIPAKNLTLLIGPEGGFSGAEYEQADAADFTAVSLGPRILRTETAAVAAIAALQSLYGDLT